MLGYVKPNKAELKIKDYEIYRGYYCSLCKALGKRYGVFSRLFLSYDVTFFVLFINALKKDYSPEFKEGRCPFNPTKKCHYTSVKTDEFDFATAFSIIMTYYKVKDNISDNPFYKKIIYFLVLPFVYFKYRKAKRIHPEIEKIIGRSIEEQATVENEKCSLVDKAAHSSAKALGECFSLYSDSEDNKQLFYRFGYCLGRYVYLTDAFDDLEKDKKHNGYNVFVLNGYSDDEITQSIRMSINELVLCVDLFDFYCNSDIIKNIVKLGLEQQLRAIINKKEGTKNEQKSL
ncbi:MAG: hypothetical protein E7515_00865 [Ruminococcaceae bacterium]|nr:hypothetical protein [Oscillospiraceae bacterium]